MKISNKRNLVNIFNKKFQKETKKNRKPAEKIKTITRPKHTSV